MENYTYYLEPYNGKKTRFKCPNCYKTGCFSKYINTLTKKYLNDNVGYCNRRIKCGYHYPPKQYFKDNNLSYDKYSKNEQTKVNKIKRQLKSKPKISFIEPSIMDKSKNCLYKNYFIDFLANHWSVEIANFLAEKYNIGTSNYWNGSTVFWQVDMKGNIRTGKIMLYNPLNGKRIKKPYNHINWVHKFLKINTFNLEQCYFGEHLLNDDLNKPVAIVESEKTAIIASVYLPEFIWLACGGVNNLNETKTKCLKGRSVVLFPDLKCYDLWNDRIPKLTSLATFKTSTLLKEKATKKEINEGLDIADYLIKIKP